MTMVIGTQTKPLSGAPTTLASGRARPRPSLSLPTPGARRAVVVGAGSFGTAVAVLLARGGGRPTLEARTQEQADRLAADGENRVYLPGVKLPPSLRVEAVGAG